MSARRAAIAIIAGAAGAILTCGPATALDKVKVTIAAVSSNYAPYFNAIEQGYFKDEGLDVEIVHAGGGIATPALISGEMDFSTSPASAFSAILKGARLKVILAEADRPTYQLWTTSADLDTIEKLKGQRVGIQTRGDTFEIWMRLVLKSHGMSGDDVGYTPLGFGNATRLAAMKTGSLPAVVMSALDVESLRQNGDLGKGHMLEDAMTDGILMPYNGVVTSDALIKQHPEIVLRFVRAVIEGTRYMTAFKDKTLANVMKYNGEDRHSTEIDYDDVVRTLTKDGSVPPPVQQAEAEIRAELMQLPKDKIPPLAQMYDFSFVQKASAELDARGWKPTP